jgi:2-oxoglutarate ferredoxin oxidoreductase subunit beta
VGYLDFHTLHTLHGRALAFATGVKLARPELKVIVPMGDGDAVAIGGNHFIHSCARNIDLTAIIMNNQIYGMTGGQVSPMTGHGERGTTWHAPQMIRLFKKAIEHKGFSVVEVWSQCPTYYGRQNKRGSAVDMMRWFGDHAVKVGSDEKADDPQRFEIGEFVDVEKPEYCQAYATVVAGAGQGKGGL